ncbi:MAG: transposase [Nanoarchaeota archaeon]|nr:transposase [Nanoarchaeota archaeon]
MVDVGSGSFKGFGRKRGDTRNNWVTMMFVTKCRFHCFRKQSHIDSCSEAFRMFETLGFEFGSFGFGSNHAHSQVNVPKRYSILVAETMLKSRSSKWMFAKHPGFRKRYPRGSFWSGYEHHESTGMKDYQAAEAYIKNQQSHHSVEVVDDRQQKILCF